MQVIAVAGASGFIGKQLLDCLSDFPDIAVRVLLHIDHDVRRLNYPNIVSVEGDLMRPETLHSLLEPDCTVVNLVYLSSRSQSENLLAISNLADACARAKVKRLVHCSTAVVAGRAPGDQITEETPCDPRNGYERTKYEIEKFLLEKSHGRFELAILRPTAVFGPGGKNLLKLANDLRFGNKFTNYLKACLYGNRRMNLVCVDNVVSALIFLIEKEVRINGEIFIASDDESAINNYRDVEKYLQKKFGYKDYTIPPIPLGTFLLSTLLKLLGRSNTNPQRVYCDRKLMSAGCGKSISFESGLGLFADWCESELNPTQRSG